MKRLVAAGADVSLADANGDTVLHRLFDSLNYYQEDGTPYGVMIDTTCLVADSNGQINLILPESNNETNTAWYDHPITQLVHFIRWMVNDYGASLALLNNQGETPRPR